MLNFDISVGNEMFAISVHKFYQDEIHLNPQEARVIKLLVFPRKEGYHSLKCFKLLDRTILEGGAGGNTQLLEDHRRRGYLFSGPKFYITKEGSGSEGFPGDQIMELDLNEAQPSVDPIDLMGETSPQQPNIESTQKEAEKEACETETETIATVEQTEEAEQIEQTEQSEKTEEQPQVESDLLQTEEEKKPEAEEVDLLS